MSVGTESPAHLARTLADLYPRMFWLDGEGGHAWSGRRSMLGFLADDDVSITFDASTNEVVRHQHRETEVIGNDPFVSLESEMAKDRFDSGVKWVGYFGYASRPDLPARVTPSHAARAPDALWMRVSRPVVVFDHPVTPLAQQATTTGADLAPDVPAEYLRAFEAVQSELRLGNSYEVNLTYRQRGRSKRPPFRAYEHLRATNGAPYGGYLQHHGLHLLSSSPERFLSGDANGILESRPMKGTRPRNANTTEDARRRVELLTDPKIRSENLIIVDLLRNDLSLVCETNSVVVPSLMQAETYAAVHQLVSVVQGKLRADVSSVGAVRAMFPPGSMTGAPKLRTMQIIESVEDSPRGVYSGAFGWICANGTLDLGVIIRTLIGRRVGTGWCYEYGTGGGVTVRSIAGEEYAESRWKADRLTAAVT